MAFGYLLSYLFRTINAALAPYLASDFGLTASSLGLLTSTYLLAFGLMQIPLGLMIDRFGVRRVQGINLLVTACGAGLFAAAESLGLLMVARAMIGAGVAVSLMASFASFIIWLPPRRVPLAIGLLMGFGGLGAMLAGAPVEFLMETVGWRTIFFGLAIATFAVSVAVLLLLPDSPRQSSSWSRLLSGLAAIYATRLFWRIVPLAILTCGTAFALQGLWAGLWLSDVAGFEQGQVAAYLSIMAFGLLVGSIACGPMASLSERCGLSLVHLVGALSLVFFVTLALLSAGLADLALPCWFLVGFLINPMSLTYVVLAQSFTPDMAGRVNTGINVLVILGSFLLQAAIGWVLDLWETDRAGRYPVEAYATAFGTLTALGLLALVWYWFGGDRGAPADRGDGARD
ncbi:MFS transporter [Futiania mangrovi]|uniref:MFS transporter n=1 Tax=Futiania mangrovi TaxID=2959716 RepID=A0A9J6PM34_9PROT|nr:MFS transporter [Futiania mangrovii]MCP1337106.1 MFS transporter [Futiania mangrovii]